MSRIRPNRPLMRIESPGAAMPVPAPSSPDGPRYAAVPPRAPARYAALPAAVRPILRLCDGTRDLAAICAAAGDPAAARIVHRLEALGLIVAEAPRRRRLTPAPVLR